EKNEEKNGENRSGLYEFEQGSSSNHAQGWTHAQPARAQRPQLQLRLFYQGMSFFRPFLVLLVDSLLLSTFFLAAGFCAPVADDGSVPVAGVDVAVLVPDAPLSLTVGGGVVLVFAGGGTAS